MTIGQLILFGAILLGVAPTVLGMIQTFSSLESGASANNGIQIAVLNGFLLTMATLPFAGLGLVLILIGYSSPRQPNGKGPIDVGRRGVSATGKRE
jgi:uncharacterized membrane protein